MNYYSGKSYIIQETTFTRTTFVLARGAPLNLNPEPRGARRPLGGTRFIHLQ